MAEDRTPSTRTISRSRGAISGILLVILGAWGAIAPFVGPYFNFAYTPDKTWHWTAARGWYEVLPGAVAFVAGLLLLFGRSRAITLLGAWLASLAGAWFVVGPPLASEITLGSLGTPIGTSSGQRAAETICLFSGLGAIIIFLGAAAFGRLSVVTIRDMRHAERREAERAEAEELAERERTEREQADRERWERDQAEQQRRDRESPDRETYQPGVFRNEPYDQQAGTTRDDDAQRGYQSGYGDGEQSTQYGSPSYGRHDAGETADPSTGTTPPSEQRAPAPPPPPTGTDTSQQTR